MLDGLLCLWEGRDDLKVWTPGLVRSEASFTISLCVLDTSNVYVLGRITVNYVSATGSPSEA